MGHWRWEQGAGSEDCVGGVGGWVRWEQSGRQVAGDDGSGAGGGLGGVDGRAA